MQLLVFREIKSVQKLVRVRYYFLSFEFKYVSIAFSNASKLINQLII